MQNFTSVPQTVPETYVRRMSPSLSQSLSPEIIVSGLKTSRININDNSKFTTYISSPSSTDGKFVNVQDGMISSSVPILITKSEYEKQTSAMIPVGQADQVPPGNEVVIQYKIKQKKTERPVGALRTSLPNQKKEILYVFIDEDYISKYKVISNEKIPKKLSPVEIFFIVLACIIVIGIIIAFLMSKSLSPKTTRNLRPTDNVIVHTYGKSRQKQIQQHRNKRQNKEQQDLQNTRDYHIFPKTKPGIPVYQNNTNPLTQATQAIKQKNKKMADFMNQKKPEQTKLKDTTNPLFKPRQNIKNSSNINQNTLTSPRLQKSMAQGNKNKSVLDYIGLH